MSLVAAGALAACSAADDADALGGDGAGGGSDGDGSGGGGGDDGGGGSPGDPSPQPGAVEVMLHPGPAAPIGEPTVVSFGAPLPPGALTDGARIAAFDAAGAPLPTHSTSILSWFPWPGQDGATESVRAAMVSVEVTFAERAPLAIELRLGEAPALALEPPSDPRADWIEVTDGEYPNGTVREPAVYATFTPEWLSACLLRHRTTTAGTDPAWDWWDEALLGYSRTAVNDVPPQVTDRIDYVSEYSPWLFDRTATLFNVYARTGDVKWLRHAHRSAQFYRRHITEDGYFSLKAGAEDLKYSYGRSLLTDYIFTGDLVDLEVIDRVASAGEDWNPVYTPDRSFWTERHQTYALLAALSAWEATGDPDHAERARHIAQVSFQHAADPPGDWPRDGCMLHGSGPICSPWMTALFADAAYQYYLRSGDPDTLPFLEGLGQYVRDHAVYDGGGDGLDYTMPWYLASSVRKVTEGGVWADIEHTCDVAGLAARGAWARAELGGDPTDLRETAEALIEGCAFILDHWHRPGSESSGRAEWRLNPARKYSWWFGTTGDLPWLMSQLE